VEILEQEGGGTPRLPELGEGTNERLGHGQIDGLGSVLTLDVRDQPPKGPVLDGSDPGTRAQRLRERPVGNGRAAVESPAAEHREAPLARPGEQLPGQSSLADPGLAKEEEHPALAPSGVVEGGNPLGHLPVPVDQERTDHIAHGTVVPGHP
jgi:hypothetical protein